MPPTSHHYYRLEISGGHSGSAYRFHSGVFGTLVEVERALADEVRDPQGLEVLVAEDDPPARSTSSP